MGFYLNTPDMPARGKTDFLLSQFSSFQEIDLGEADQLCESGDEAVIVVVDNYGTFEAAAFAFDRREFEAFTERDDLRPKRYIKAPRNIVEELTHYSK